MDWLRFLALFEIAAFHSPAGRVPLIAGLGLPLLLLITNLYNVTSTESRGWGAFVRDKFRRLLVPWIFWCAVFGALAMALAIRKGDPLAELFSLRTLLTGTWAHLWFVPFVLFSGVLVAALHRSTRNWRPTPVIVIAALAGLAWMVLAARFDAFFWSLGHPVPQWTFSLSSVPYGFAIGRAMLLTDKRRRRLALAALALAAALVYGVSVAFDAPWSHQRYAAAVLLVVVAAGLDIPSDRVVAVLAPLTLGVYLANPFVLRLLVAAKLPLHSEAAWAALVLLLTVPLVWGMRRVSWLRRFV